MKKRLLATITATMMALQPTMAKAETMINMGEFKATYYCPCHMCSEGYGRVTATTHKTGLLAEAGRTIAVDPSVLPLGVKIIFGDKEYITEDVGGGVIGDHIDIFVENHDDIPTHGVDYDNIWIVR